MILKSILPASLLASFLASSLSATAQSPDDPAKAFPPGKGREIVVSVCQECHGLEQIASSQRSPEGWKDLVNEMVSNGAPLDDSQVETVAQYLAANFKPPDAAPADALNDASKDRKESPAKTKIKVNKATAKELQAGLELSEKDAGTIMAYREKHGDFKNLGDLEKVPGVDAKKIEAAKDRLEF